MVAGTLSAVGLPCCQPFQRLTRSCRAMAAEAVLGEQRSEPGKNPGQEDLDNPVFFDGSPTLPQK